MSIINFQLTAEEADAVAAFMDVQRQIKAMEDRTKAAKGQFEDTTASAKQLKEMMSEVSTSSKDAFNATAGGAKSSVDVMDTLSKGIGTATQALGFMGEMAGRQFEEMNARANKFRENLDALEQTLSRTGDVDLLPEVRKQLQSISSNELTQKQITDLFGVVSREGDGQLGTDQILEIVRESVAARAAGKDASAFAKTMTALAGAGVTADDTGSVGDKTAELLGVFPEGLGDTEQKFLSQGVASGVDQNTILRLLAASKTSDQGAGVIGKMMNLVNQDIDPTKLAPKRMLTAEQQEEKQRIDARLLEIDKQKLSIEEQAQATPHRKRVFESEKQKLDLEAKTLSLRSREIDQAAPLSLDGDQQRLAKLAALPKAARMSAILQDPALIGDEKAGLTALLDADTSGMFSQGGRLEEDARKRRVMLNNDPYMRQAAKNRIREIELENDKSTATLGDLAMQGQALNFDQEFEAEKRGKRGVFSKIMADVTESMPGFVKNLQRSNFIGRQEVAVSREGLAVDEVLEKIEKNSRPRGNAVAREPGGVERDPVRGY